MKKKPKQQEENIYQQFLDSFGEDVQYLITFEEMSELTKALTKYIRKKTKASDLEKQKLIDDIAEEIADVEFTMEELKYMFNLRDKVEKIKHFKLERGKERIKQKNLNLEVEREIYE